LISKLQLRFHVEPLLILDTINSRPAFWSESLHKISFRSHGTAVGPPSRKQLEWTLPPLRPHHRWCHYRVGTPSLPPPPMCWDLFDTTTAAPSSSPPLERHWGPLRPSDPHLSGAAVNLQAPLPPPSTSCLGHRLLPLFLSGLHVWIAYSVLHIRFKMVSTARILTNSHISYIKSTYLHNYFWGRHLNWPV
jgi:hypothetical protein